MSLTSETILGGTWRLIFSYEVIVYVIGETFLTAYIQLFFNQSWTFITSYGWNISHRGPSKIVRGARFVLGSPYQRRSTESVTEMLKELGWETLERRRNISALTFIYKMTNNLIEIPQKYHPTQLRTSTRHSNEKAFQTYQPRVDAFRYSLLPKTIPFGIHYHQKSYLLQHLICSNQV